MATHAIDPDALTMDTIRSGALTGRPVTVLGFARTGIALARFLDDAGARVTVYDARPADQLRASIEQLEGRSVGLRLGPDVVPASVLADAALVTSSPSVNPDYPTTEPRLRAALASMVATRAAGAMDVPALVSEPDLFLRLCVAPTIGVTGTKGKTTTASLIAALLSADPRHRTILGGNIGRPIVEHLPELTPSDRVVYELSELQLPTLSRGTTVAVYTNVTADHLDRHGSLEAYRRAKRRLAELVDPAGALILNIDDPVVAGYRDLAVARTITYRQGTPEPDGLGVVDGWIVAATSGVPEPIMPTAELAIPGAHNVSNAMAAIAVARLFGVDPAQVRAAAGAFMGVEHRLETVAIADGIRFVNDSQGTQPDAVIAALDAFDRPIVLIAGGRDKGIDLSRLARHVADRAAAAVVMGESGAAMAAAFRSAGLGRVESADSMSQAVRMAADLAGAARDDHPATGDDPARLATVLLSPAAASFDMFEDYAARGAAFKAAVAEATAGEGHR